MPIFDNDGTTNYQIGKVYDNDGTTNNLIYTADFELLAAPTNDWTTKQKTKYGGSGGSATVSNSSPYLKAIGGGEKVCNYCVTKAKVDFNGYNTLKMTATYIGSATGTTTHSGVFLACSEYQDLDFTYGDVQGFYNLGTTGYNNLTKTFLYDSPVSRTTQTLTYDISNLNGSYYIMVGAFRGAASTAAEIEVTALLLE